MNGQCVCDPGFAGSNCQYLDLLPASDPNIEGFDDPNYPAWGGNAIYANGEYHFIVSYMVNKCYITSYGTNSAILRAAGNFPWGPFTFKEEILPPFHHGARVLRDVNKNYLVFGDGKDMPPFTVQTNCQGQGRRVLTQNEADARFKSESRARRRFPRSKYKRYSKGQSNLYPIGSSPNDEHFVASAITMSAGTWNQDQRLLKDFQTNIKIWDSWDCNKTNLSPVILPNGTVVMAYRSKSCLTHQQQGCGNFCQHIAVAVSENGVNGPYTLPPKSIPILDGNEDPFLWYSSKGWHMLLHGKNICGDYQAARDTCGAYAYSSDLINWYLSPYPAYTMQVTFDPSLNIPPENLKYRQRPALYFSNEGIPMVLYNSGQRFQNNYVRNFAFRFNVSQVTNYEAPPACPPNYWMDQCTQFNRNAKFRT